MVGVSSAITDKVNPSTDETVIGLDVIGLPRLGSHFSLDNQGNISRCKGGAFQKGPGYC